MTDSTSGASETEVVASRIRGVDRELAAMELARDESIVRGMRAPGSAAVVERWGQDRADGRHATLLAERADLVARLKALIEPNAS